MRRSQAAKTGSKASHAQFLKIQQICEARTTAFRGRSASVMAAGNEWSAHGVTEEEVERRDDEVVNTYEHNA